MITAVQGHGAPLCVSGAAAAALNRDGPSFARTLEEVMRPDPAVRFSVHASQRLHKRAIELTDAQKTRLEEATNTAAASGARESLLLMDGLAFVVNIPKRTVITAMTVGEMGSIVITNIDSAVVTSPTTAPRNSAIDGLAPLREVRVPRNA